jgi:flagellar basal body-associated protein FliL
MYTWRWRRTAHEIFVVFVDRLTHRTEVARRRATAMVVLMIAVIIPMIVVLALLRAAVVVIVALIGARVQQRGSAQHQHAQAGNQTFRHFHRVFPHCTYSKKGFRT